MYFNVFLVSCDILTPDVCLSSCTQPSLSTPPPPTTFFFFWVVSLSQPFNPAFRLHPQRSLTSPDASRNPRPLLFNPPCTGPVRAGGDGRSGGGAGRAQGESSPPVGGTSGRQGLRPPRVPAVSAVPRAQQPNQGNSAPSSCCNPPPPPLCAHSIVSLEAALSEVATTSPETSWMCWNVRRSP